jgi:hypothetical protein
MPNNAPIVAFLGVVERALQVQDVIPGLWKYNIIGLKRVILSHIFPMNLAGHGLAFAMYDTGSTRTILLRVVHSTSGELGSCTIEMRDASGQKEGDALIREQWTCVPAWDQDWAFTVLPGQHFEFVIPQPGTVRLHLSEGGQDTLIGQIHVGLVDPEPLTPSRIAAIRSDPTAAKAVRVAYGCKKCGGAVKAYAGLERLPEQESDGYIWFENLPERGSCPCGALNLDLTIIRRNLHGLLGARCGVGEWNDTAFVPLYEKGAVESVRANFSALLGVAAPEETFQKFIEDNPILLHQFAPQRIFFKASILSLRKTDFAIVNHQSELVLIRLYAN